MLATGAVLSIVTLDESVVAETSFPAFPCASVNQMMKPGVRLPVVVTIPCATKLFPEPVSANGVLFATPLMLTVNPASDSLPLNETVIVSPSRANDPLPALSDWT